MRSLLVVLFVLFGSLVFGQSPMDYIMSKTDYAQFDTEFKKETNGVNHPMYRDPYSFVVEDKKLLIIPQNPNIPVTSCIIDRNQIFTSTPYTTENLNANRFRFVIRLNTTCGDWGFSYAQKNGKTIVVHDKRDGGSSIYSSTSNRNY